MSQPNTESSPPPAKAARGCVKSIAKVLLVLIVLAAVAGLVVWLQRESNRRKALEETVLTELVPPKEMALKAVQAHEEVQAELGDPIAEKGDSGNLRREGTGELDRSNAAFSFDVAGPKAAAVVNATAKQADGNWQISQIKVQLAGGKTIDVPPPNADAPVELEFGP
jgi:hypothetical protein